MKGQGCLQEASWLHFPLRDPYCEVLYFERNGGEVLASLFTSFVAANPQVSPSGSRRFNAPFAAKMMMSA